MRAALRVANLILAVVAILMTLGIAEVVVRVAGWSEMHLTDPVFQQSRYPGVVYEFKSNAKGYTWGRTWIETNTDGLNDREFTIPKPGKALRIGVFGDSFSFGQGVRREETFAKVLERALQARWQARGVEIQVLNFAVPSYSISNIVSSFCEKGVRYDLDVAILAPIGQDYGLHRNHKADEYGYPVQAGSPMKPGLLKNLLRRVHLSYVVRDAFQAVRGYAQPELSALTNDEGALASRTWTRGAREIDRFIETARARGVDTLYLSMESRVLPQVEKLLSQTRLRHVRLEPVLRDQAPRALRVSSRDGHPSALYHELIAGALVDSVDELLNARAPTVAARR